MTTSSLLPEVFALYRYPNLGLHRQTLLDPGRLPGPGRRSRIRHELPGEARLYFHDVGVAETAASDCRRRPASAASYANQAVAPGEGVLLFGASYSPASLAASRPDASGHLPTEVSNARLWFDNTPASIVCARAGQTAAVVPFAGGAATRSGRCPINSPVRSNQETWIRR